MPASTLYGLTTPCGWTITESLTNELGSGGTFCKRYLAADPDGREGFLKAMDLRSVFERTEFSSALDRLKAIEKQIKEYVFEQEILQYCKESNMTRVVTPLSAGEMTLRNLDPPLNQVFYVIFEKADGDMRQHHMEAHADEQDWLLTFKMLHHVTLGVGQLHRAGVAHQDIKPSNVLCFETDGSKISDLGRVTAAHEESPFSNLPFTGDRGYMPPELSHGYRPVEFSERYCADAFMVGSLVFHVVTGIQLRAVMLQEAQSILPTVLHESWEYALPIYLNAFGTILERFEAECERRFGRRNASALRTIVQELGHPDPLQRGRTGFKNRLARLSMERYTGLLASIILNTKIHRRP